MLGVFQFCNLWISDQLESQLHILMFGKNILTPLSDFINNPALKEED